MCQGQSVLGVVAAVVGVGHCLDDGECRVELDVDLGYA